MTNLYRVGASLLTILTLTTPAFAHSGRTNAQGCHAGSQPYHCHGSGTALRQSNSGGCHPSYQGACVPIARDVDCGGGSGNGPAYVWSTVRVVGPDVYGLDRDRDGWGCE